MSDRARVDVRDAARSLGAELALWSLAVGAFLLVYVGQPGVDGRVVGPHVALVATGLGACWCLRLAAWRCCAHEGVARAIAAGLVAAMLASLIVYYALVLIGLASWGRVVTWTLLVAYAHQVPGLADALGLPWPAVVLGLLSAIAALAWLGDRAVTRQDWLRLAAERTGAPVVGAIAIAGLAIVAIRIGEFRYTPSTAVREPLSLTFFPAIGGRKLQTQVFGGSATLAQAADADRAAYQPAALERRPNVVVIVIDALRADRLPFHGGLRETAPYLTGLVRSGRAVAVDPVAASCAESFCGLMALARSKPVHQLTDRDISLYEVLRRHGYRVHLLLSGDHTSFYNLREAYGTTDTYWDASMARRTYANDDEAVVARARALPVADGTPTFVQFHLMSAHPLGTRQRAFLKYTPSEVYLAWQSGRSSAIVPSAANHYDNGLLQADDVVRRLIATLQERGYLDDALVVITGDHGEMLGDHGEFGHSGGVFEPALRVPMVFVRFGKAPALDLAPGGALGSQLDLAPTIAEWIGMPRPRTWAGEPLQALPERRILTFRQGHFVGAYRVGPGGSVLKYWAHVKRGRERAFDVVADPAERVDLLGRLDPAELATLRAALLPVVASIGD